MSLLVIGMLGSSGSDAAGGWNEFVNRHTVGGGERVWD